MPPIQEKGQLQVWSWFVPVRFQQSLHFMQRFYHGVDLRSMLMPPLAELEFIRKLVIMAKDPWDFDSISA